MDFILWLIFGLVAGILAMLAIYRTIPRKPPTLIAALVVGLAGGWLGGFLLDLLGLEGASWLGSIVIAFAGACLILWLLRRSLPGAA